MFPSARVELAAVPRAELPSPVDSEGNSMHRARGYRGFTFVELLVVLVILLVAVAILAPTILRIRIAADRVSCSSRLKQLGVSIYQYHNTHQSFPGNGGDRPSLYATLYDFLETRGGLAVEAGTKAIRDWQCPSRGFRPVSTAVNGVEPCAPADYAAADHPGCWRDPGSDRPRYPGKLSVFGHSGSIYPMDDEPCAGGRRPPLAYRPIDLTTLNKHDGSSETLLLAHLSSDPDAYADVPGWNRRKFHVPDCRRILEDRDFPGHRSISAPHPTAMPVLFADGSVRSARYQKVPNDIVPRMWAFNDEAPAGIE